MGWAAHKFVPIVQADHVAVAVEDSELGEEDEGVLGVRGCIHEDAVDLQDGGLLTIQVLVVKLKARDCFVQVQLFRVDTVKPEVDDIAVLILYATPMGEGVRLLIFGLLMGQIRSEGVCKIMECR